MHWRKKLGVQEATDNPGQLWRAVLAEFVATTTLLTFGCAVSLPWPSPHPQAPPTGITEGLGGGFAVAAAMQFSSHISGAHLNPAVTLALLAGGRCTLTRAFLYIAAQLLAGIVAVALLYALVPTDLHANLCYAQPATGITDAQAVGIELIITFVLVTTACALGDGRAGHVKGVEPLIMGVTVATCHIVAVKWTGCGLNPARVLGPSVITGQWHRQWVYYTGEFIGGLAAAIFYFGFLTSNVRDASNAKDPALSLSDFQKSSRFLRPRQ